ncbi:hypothetical protein HYH03_010175 [Edaphochlamys debaryana]|uniref:F5/8 type C domain-containing protein n=1 Tax=Edaphochlamys debaryana TaxID=47281 RepID=A0A836BXM7_9CHLO|nr:hypothetical protein HYH03_010175 [Edaphochlamys debaryana]|eukprot:KAG2491383.1 hypothetical protein HYH03_010175 [Edaphochlamys debaryana]
MEWTGWRTTDQFGWEQPALEDIVGPNGRSKLSGIERPHDYQVSISFPGADFDKGSEGHVRDLLDHEGRVLASSGTEFAEALQGWLRKGWLDGDEDQALRHVFVCSKNLRYCPGSIKAKGFRHYLATNPDASPDVSTAILNENWAMYLRESFVEARVVVFVINEDWLDSIPCNQEFEALITRKNNFRQAGTGQGFKEGLAHEARKYFDVFQITYNAQTSAEGKLKAQTEFVDVVAKYSVKHEPPPQPGMELRDLTGDAKEVDWPNWMYYRALEGSNGWETLIEVRDVIKEYGEDGFGVPTPRLLPVTHKVASRRFRFRFMGITGDVFNEGYKYMAHPFLLVDEATGANIVAEGKGYFRTVGERMGTLGMSHWVGPKQYTWMEWLVPDDQPPVVVSQVDVRANARRFVVEAMPVSAWPLHGDTLKDYTFLAFGQASSTDVTQPPKWVPLHEAGSGASGEVQLPAVSPPCKAFRLRVLETTGGGSGEPTAPVVGRLRLKVAYPEGLFAVGGGKASGTGGNTAMEDAPPAFAFDGDEQTRWVDIDGGGIGNVARLEYEDTAPVEIVEYHITSQVYALSSYHSHMNGTPRDWTLKAKAEGQDEWMVVDTRSQVYFTNHQERKKFQVAKPMLARIYAFEFTAVAAGCASRSIQIGMLDLFARSAAHTADLGKHQVVVLPSAYNSAVSAAQAAWPPGELAPVWGISWPEAGALQFVIPQNARGYGVVTGGKVGWVQGEGRVSNWYDHPLEFDDAPTVHPDDLDLPVKPNRIHLVVRPRKEVLTGVDHVHSMSFRREYPGGEAELVHTYTRPFALKAYAITSAENYVRGDPRSWSLQAAVPDGSGGDAWVTLHAVTNFWFPDRSARALFQLPGNTVEASKYRLVITEMNAMVALLHLQQLALFKQLAPEEQEEQQQRDSAGTGTDTDARAAGSEPPATDTPAAAAGGARDALAVPYFGPAHVTLKVRPREGEDGFLRLAGYSIEAAPAELGGVRPAAWVLEGLTSTY